MCDRHAHGYKDALACGYNASDPMIRPLYCEELKCEKPATHMAASLVEAKAHAYMCNKHIGWWAEAWDAGCNQDWLRSVEPLT